MTSAPELEKPAHAVADTVNPPSPFYDAPGFLTDKERDWVAGIVLAMKADWQLILPDEQEWVSVAKQLHRQGYGFYTLGDAVYLLGNDKKSVDQINGPQQARLAHFFEGLNNQVMDHITTLTGVKTELHGITQPGFHISTLPVHFTPDQMHVDFGITHFEPDADPETVRSVLILISEPEEGAWLEYEKDGQVGKKRYELGALHQWEGMMLHRIADLKATNGMRITYQAHYYYDPNTKTNRMYF